MKNQIQKTFNFFIALLVFSTLISSCKKDDDSDSNPIPPSGATLKTAVLGTIKDTDGLIVSGATVKLGTYTTITDTRGNFQFINADVPKDRMVIIASKDGFFDCVRAKRTQSGEANYIHLLMEEKPAAVNVAGVAGGVVNIPGGAKITFPANAFVDAAGNAYTGTVKVFARHISPGNDNFEAIVPGGDLSGINSAGQVQSLYSLGMIEAILTDNTGLTEVKLAPGKTAELKFPIDPSQTSSAQSTVPMWHMNENTGVWKEEGEAVKTGNFFIGDVSHFSTWNCDYSGERTDIQGKVVDCNNNPMPGIVVTINGFMTVVTDNNGMYTTWVPAGYTITVQALLMNNPILLSSSNTQTLSAVAGINNIMPNITASCLSRLAGAIGNCSGTELMPGSIYVTWNGGNFLQYTSTGNYIILVPVNTNLNIIVTDNQSFGTISALSGGQNDTLLVPNILICNSTTNVTSKFTVTDGVGVVIPYTLNVTTDASQFFDTNSDGAIDSTIINLFGTTNPGNYDFTLYSYLVSEINGMYSLNQNLNSITITIMINGTLYFYTTSQQTTITTLNRLKFTDYSGPGGFATGIFEFDAGLAGTITEGQFATRRQN